MKVTFLGTGTSQGVPMIGCECEVCTSTDKKDKRLRSSVLIEDNDTTIVIDSGPDFRYQMLRADVKNLDAILFTHSHKDHIAGLDDVRAFNFFSKKPMQIFATEETQEALKREFHYVFNNAGYPGVPQLELNTITHSKSFKINELEIQPILVKHMYMDVLGFRINDFTYITDANYIDPSELLKVNKSNVLVLNALRHIEHPSHFTLNEAIDVAKATNSNDTYLTHISHQLGKHYDIDNQLPTGIHLSYDELSLEI